jgi:hypothetical protein
MFWGTIVKQGENYRLASLADGEVVHLSNCALGTTSEGKIQLFAKVNGKEFILAYFEKNKVFVL